jgi:hypothetical protein
MRLALLVPAVLISVSAASSAYAESKPASNVGECVIQDQRIDCSCVGAPDAAYRASGRRCRDDRVQQNTSWLTPLPRPSVEIEGLSLGGQQKLFWK